MVCSICAYYAPGRTDPTQKKHVSYTKEQAGYTDLTLKHLVDHAAGTLDLGYPGCEGFRVPQLPPRLRRRQRSRARAHETVAAAGLGLAFDLGG